MKHETTDASPRLIAMLGGSLLAIVGVCLLVAAAVGPWGVHSLTPDRRFENGAVEQTDIAREEVEQDRLVQEHLEGYGWVDRAHGIVRIPISRAMDLLLAESSSVSAVTTTPTKAAP